MLNPIDYSISKFITFADTDALTQIRRLTTPVALKKGATIETRGNPVDHIFLIEEGLVRIGINGADGSRFNLARLGAGHTFGESDFFLGQNVTYDANAETDVVLRKLSKPTIEYLMTHSLSFSRALMAVSSMRVQTILSYIGDTLGMTLLARVAKQILSVSESISNNHIVSLRQVELAHSLGVSRVTIGKALKALADQDLIKIGYGKLEIVSRHGLINVIEKGQRKL